MRQYLLTGFIALISVIAVAQNYVVEVTPLQPTNHIEFQGEEPTCSVDHNAVIQYYDGFGNPSQMCQLGVTPDGDNLVSITRRNGITGQEWLPISTEQKQVTFDEIRALYRDTYPYTETTYAYASSNKIAKVQSAGMSWQNHPSTIQYSENEANEVLEFSVNTEGNLSCIGYYNAYRLQKVVSSDEDGHEQTTYTNRQGQIILSKTANSCTYYVYDSMNRLRFVLPPMLSSTMSSNNNYTIDDLNIKKYAYCYQYDKRGNVIYKRLPGCEPIHMVYDQTNRLVMSQDGNLRNKDNGEGKWWMVTKYDPYGRPAYTCLINTLTNNWEEKIQDFSEWVMTETFSSATQPNPLSNTGYSKNYYHNRTYQLLHVWYYDNYQFLDCLTTGQKAPLLLGSYQGISSIQEPSSVGRLTGERIYNLEGSEYITKAYYYDCQGNIIQTRSNNHQGGYTFAYSNYDYCGKPLKTITIHTSNFGISTNETYLYSYDNTGRLKTIQYQYNNEPMITMSLNIYDSFGRLCEQRIHNNLGKNHFGYDIHGNLMHNRQLGFYERLYYNTPNIYGGGNEPTYNGNISSCTWSKASTNSIVRNATPELIDGYHYTYDAYNRLSKGQSIINRIQNNTRTEQYQYDQQGNITRLSRPNIDNLYLSYQGNQLTSVLESGTDQHSTSVKEFTTINSGQYSTYQYDANGNMTYDSGRGIAIITYNLLNLPQMILFSNGNSIHHYYDAEGVRYKSTFGTRQGAATYAANRLMDQDISEEANVSSSTLYYTHLLYNDNIEYKVLGLGTPALTRVHNTEGYVAPNADNDEEIDYYYFAKDHIGNIREVYRKAANTNYLRTVQQIEYYPSGLPWANATNSDLQPYKYAGTEFVEMHGLDEYDNHARWFYPAIMRTTTMDPLCEKYYATSPYAWCNNNPVNIVDPTGMDGYRNNNGKYEWFEGRTETTFCDKDGIEWTHVTDNYHDWHEANTIRNAVIQGLEIVSDCSTESIEQDVQLFDADSKLFTKLVSLSNPQKYISKWSIAFNSATHQKDAAIVPIPNTFYSLKYYPEKSLQKDVIGIVSTDFFEHFFEFLAEFIESCLGDSYSINDPIYDMHYQNARMMLQMLQQKH